MREHSCVVMEPIDLWDVFLRVYEIRDDVPCNIGVYHQALTLLYRKPGREVDSWNEDYSQPIIRDVKDIGRYEWPKFCTCGYEFSNRAARQYHPIRMWQNQETGEILQRKNFPVGALWRNTWLESNPHYRGEDGQSWSVLTPGGEWAIDGPCSNCTRPTELHHCWCRHGVAPNFTVDKTGNTCSAGGGSILVGEYHGFLRDGKLVPA